MDNDELRALASHCAEHVTRFEGGDPKEYATYMYQKLKLVRNKTVEAAAGLADESYDILDLTKLPGKIRRLAEDE